MSTMRPLVFGGSSSEGRECLEDVVIHLDDECEVVPWYHGIYQPSEFTLESLDRRLDQFDFAILVLTPDDLVESRGRKSIAPRDNVLLEIGFCMGRLGRKRTFVMVDQNAALKLPSDLDGVTVVTFRPSISGGSQAASAGACARIRRVIRKIGPREDRVREVQLTAPVSDLGLSQPILVSLAALHVGTVEDLTDYSREELLDIPEFGLPELKEVESRLRSVSLELKTAVRPK